MNIGSDASRYRTAPHEHPPSRCALIERILWHARHRRRSPRGAERRCRGDGMRRRKARGRLRLGIGALVVVLVAAGLLSPADRSTKPTSRDGFAEPRPLATAALTALAALPVKGRAPKTGYDRERFG